MIGRCSMLDVVVALESLCDACSGYLDNLPTFERDTRIAALATWCLAYKCRDYDALPIYWHKSVGTLLIGLRLCRVGSMYKERSEEVTECGVVQKGTRQGIRPRRPATGLPWVLADRSGRAGNKVGPAPCNSPPLGICIPGAAPRGNCVALMP